MELKNYISIWIGNFSSEKELENYVSIYNWDIDNEPMKSLFWDEYQIDDAELDLQEIGWKESILTFDDLISGASYWKQYLEAIKKNYKDIDPSRYNSVILIGRYKYEGKINQSENTYYLGAYEVQE